MGGGAVGNQRCATKVWGHACVRNMTMSFSIDCPQFDSAVCQMPPGSTTACEQCLGRLLKTVAPIFSHVGC
eukprot:366555-Chlamydomonas_euryale.AAC.26